MAGYVINALFIHDEAGSVFLESITSNQHGVVIIPITLEIFEADPDFVLAGVEHVVVSGEMSTVKKVLLKAAGSGITVGILPLAQQKTMRQGYGIPKSQKDMISLALQDEAQFIDLAFCNDKLLLFKGVVGRLPVFDESQEGGRLRLLFLAIQKMISLRLLPFMIEVCGKNKAKLKTAASSCLVMEIGYKEIGSRLVGYENSLNDGMLSLLIIAPKSILDYLNLVWIRLSPFAGSNRLPSALGYVKSPEIKIDTDNAIKVTLDGHDTTETPARFHVEPAAVKINVGMEKTQGGAVGNVEEHYQIHSLPAGKELLKARGKRIPFFTYASEERFRDLFTRLRNDAQLDSTYIVLMVLSTVLATLGLYLDSASVIIGAMLLAPLMAPIISLAMSLLRYDRTMFRKSLVKIAVGIFLALGTACMMTVISPYQPMTNEMAGRLNPTVLDLLIAIAAGIAGAYTKSYKEVLDSLAGVAIAVALVPPLAVAGIGLGRLEPHFFNQAFLLFLTNLIGIVLAATLSFRILGFSPVVRDKRNLLMVTFFFVLISIPLSVAFQGITERAMLEKSWQSERFLVNGKYLIVQNAKLHKFRERQLLVVDLLVREHLTRFDLSEFKRKVKENVTDEIVIRANVTYIP